MKYIHDSRKVVFFGKSGKGKTLSWTKLIRVTDYGTYFVFDHDGQFSWRTGMGANYTLQDLDAELRSGFVVFNPVHLFRGRTREAFAFFCEWAYEVSGRRKGAKLFCCDELQKYTEVNKLPWSFSALLESGRHVGLDLAACTIAPNRVHNQVRGLATEIVTFQLDEPLHLDALAERGFDREAIKRLAKFQFLARNLDTGDQEEGFITP